MESRAFLNHPEEERGPATGGPKEKAAGWIFVAGLAELPPVPPPPDLRLAEGSDGGAFF